MTGDYSPTPNISTVAVLEVCLTDLSFLGTVTLRHRRGEENPHQHDAKTGHDPRREQPGMSQARAQHTCQHREQRGEQSQHQALPDVEGGTLRQRVGYGITRIDSPASPSSPYLRQHITFWCPARFG